MKRRELSDNIIEITESAPEEVAELLSRFNVGEYWEKYFYVPNDPRDTTEMIRYIESLRRGGLDIGKGDSQFGYKMPIPEKHTSTRQLQIYRRK